jgi:hypothetical protein
VNFHLLPNGGVPPHMISPNIHVIANDSYRRYGVFAAVAPPVTEPTHTEMGLEIVTTFVIRESEKLVDGFRQYELLVDGEVVWSGMDDDRAGALLEAILAATGQATDIPNN